MTPGDLLTVASACRRAMDPLAGGDWDRSAGDLEWSCRVTLAHMIDAVAYYAVNLATRSTQTWNTADVDPATPVEVLLEALEGHAAVLAEVCRAAPPGTRAAHSMGRADASGFAAMGCDEMLIHTDDVMAGLGATFDPPRDVCARVLARLFPWAPRDEEPWATLRWANGRAPLGNRPRVGPGWVWHCAPLDEWDGADPNAALRSS